uniref:YqaJ viral recombinase domain-containing protein n=1 Tax=Clytia hemisphaerica TaxID=252671 RepID=A0A7M5X4X3_9CNID|eukprot:TCONS_00019954-protein
MTKQILFNGIAKGGFVSLLQPAKLQLLWGGNFSEYDSFHPHFSFISKKLWFPSNCTSIYMQYGVEYEKIALKEYGEKRNASVTLSGLWINKKYAHLAASPDGLLINDGKIQGILEVKCLKILKLHTVSDIVNEECPKAEVARQCFKLSDGKLVLKKCHMYYYQIQLQLLITETDFCDFILYCYKGPSHVERILPDLELQQKIITNTRLFWEKVYIPEYFLMRVPRDLLPLVVE